MEKRITSLEDLINELPEEEMGAIKELTENYEYVLRMMESYAKDGVDPLLILNSWGKAGSQWIATFEVKDRDRPMDNKHNWHGQNVSQWLFAGCICVQDGRVSIHT